MRTTFPVEASPAGWAALGDPAVLAAALRGSRSVTAVGDSGSLQVVADVAVASVRGLWSGTVVRVDADAVRVAGSGAPGTVDLVVRADPARTMLTVEGTVDGPLATVGSAVLAAAVRRMAEDLLTAAGAPVPTPAADTATPGGTAAPPGSDPVVSGGRRLPTRVAAAAAGVVVVVVLGRRRRTRRRSG